MTLEEMIDDLRDELGVDETDLPDEKIKAKINDSINELESKFAFRNKDHRLDFSTVAEEPKYTLPTVFESLVTASVMDPQSDQKHVLERMTETYYEEVYNAADSERGIPTHYLRDNHCIILYPTPDDEYRVTLRYNKTLAELVSLTNEPDMPKSWHEIVKYGALWRFFITLGDYARANQIKAHQIELISSSVPIEAKEEFDTHTGGVRVLGYNSSGDRWSR